MNEARSNGRVVVPALRVRQWLPEWDQIEFDEKLRRKRPEPYFYVFSLPASTLLALSAIYRRSVDGLRPRSEDTGIQRALDRGRADQIAEFVRHGYPWSELQKEKKATGKYDHLRKPGWLPTAIVVNILRREETRFARRVDPADLIDLAERTESAVEMHLPSTFTGLDWTPKELAPIEVIDGQHRLWAFTGEGTASDFELPVVAFHGLDLSWQAYLFWSINITPKRINASLAFDMYPLLRTEDWLDRPDELNVYRETRAQELTEALWSHPDSPWRGRINMLGERGLGRSMVTQAAWVRSLIATYVKASEGRRISIGGLFGAPLGTERQALPWTRAQQAAFIIRIGQHLERAVRSIKDRWAQTLRPDKVPPREADPAFAGPHALINTDQGIRALLHVTNDVCFVRAVDLNLAGWLSAGSAAATDHEMVSAELQSLSHQPVDKFLSKAAERLSGYDWRTSSAPGLTEPQRQRKAAFRGSGGYKELRQDLLRHLARGGDETAGAATLVLKSLGYER